MPGPLLIRADRALLGSDLRAVDVLVEDRTITAVRLGLPAPEGALVLEAAVLAPGFVDLHVHALDGHGMVGPGAPDIPGMSQALAARGVTGFLATTVTAPLDVLLDALADPAMGEGARCLGVHLEGPWLAESCAGAQPVEHLASPDLNALEQLLSAGPPAMITLAPELPDAMWLIALAVASDVVISLGHSAATYEQALAGFGAGARHVTHCFNAMAPLHHREPGLVGAALDQPGVTLEVIADGVHLHPSVVRLLWRAAGPKRLCLVSDAVDLPDVGGTGVATLADGTLAGSRIGLDQAVRNLTAWGIPLVDALTMASTTPASVLGQWHAIEIGAPADLVLLDDQLEVIATVVDGSVVWQR